MESEDLLFKIMATLTNENSGQAKRLENRGLNLYSDARQVITVTHFVGPDLGNGRYFGMEV